MKKYGIYIVISIVGLGSIFGVNTINGKVNEIDAKSYIGKTYEDLPRELKQKGIDVLQETEGAILTLLINNKNYHVDTVRVGDSIDKIDKVYPKEWVNKGEHTIKISYGQENHYGVVTDYIIYVVGKDEKVQSIIIGKTADFIETPLPTSNKEAKALLEGKWQSQYGRILEFNKDELTDNYMKFLWDKQNYIVVAPNQLLIYREKENQEEKLSLYFWIDGEKLYLFTINEDGIPIETSIEAFSKMHKNNRNTNNNLS